MLTFINSSDKNTPPIFVMKPAKTVSPIPRYLQEKKRQNALNFFHCVQPVYYVSRFFGFAPFTFKCNSKGEVIGSEVKAFDLIWFFISLTSYCAVAYACTRILRLPRLDASFVLIAGNQMLLIASILNGAFAVAFDMYNRHRLVELTIQMTEFDREIKSLGILIDYRRERKRIGVWYFGSSLISFILMGLSYYFNESMNKCQSIPQRIIFYGAHALRQCTWTIVSTKYLFLLTSLYSRHHQINIVLRFVFSLFKFFDANTNFYWILYYQKSVFWQRFKATNSFAWYDSHPSEAIDSKIRQTLWHIVQCYGSGQFHIFISGTISEIWINN